MVLAPARSVSAYSLEGAQWPANTAVVLSLSLGSNGQGQLSDGSANFDVVATQAANLWNLYISNGVRVLPTLNGAGTGYQSDRINSVFFASNYFGNNFGSALAVTQFRYSGSQLFETDVVFSTLRTWDSFRGPASPSVANALDLRRVAIHEFGHVLGLDHPDQHGQNNVAIMNSHYSPSVDVMQGDDIAGVEFLYNGPPPNMGNPPPVNLNGTEQILTGATGHVFSSPGDAIGGGIEALLNASTGYGGARYRRDVDPATGNTLHRFFLLKNGAEGAGEWTFTFSMPAGQFLVDGVYDINQNDSYSARPFIYLRYENNISYLAPGGQLILRGVTYSGTNITSIAADFRLSAMQNGMADAAPRFIAGQLRFNTPTIPFPASRLVNLSTRVNVGLGYAQAIAGAIFRDSTGAGKSALVRVLGPSLVPRGVTGVLLDPVVDVYQGSTHILRNDDWEGDPPTTYPAFSQLALIGLLPSQPQESSIINRYYDGGYTTVVSGLDQNNLPNGTGIGLVEIFDLEIGGDASLANVSTRGLVGTGANVMIGGFIIQGTTPKQVIVRAIGPSLAAFNVPGVLANPTLTVYNASGQIIAQNDDWQTDPNSATVIAKNLGPGDPKESAIYLILNPGAYTAIVSGVGGTTGIGLVEIYDAD